MLAEQQNCFLGLVRLVVILFLCVFIANSKALAQQSKDTANKINIEILSANFLDYVQTDSGAINKLIGNASMKQGEAFMYCDSAYFNLAKNTMEAFGNVRVVQPGSEAQSDYMRYVGNQKTGYLKGNVMLTDGRSHLWSEDLTYNTATKVGVYTQGGTLQDSTTTLSSNAGSYNTKTKDARFTGEVIVTEDRKSVV